MLTIPMAHGLLLAGLITAIAPDGSAWAAGALVLTQAGFCVLACAAKRQFSNTVNVG